MITEDAIHAAEAARTAAMVAGDLDTLDGLLHASLRYGHTSGVVDTKAGYLAKLRTGEVAYTEMTTVPTAYALLGEVAALWVEGRGQATTPAGEKALHAATLTLWVAGPHGLPQMIAHQPTVLP